MMDDYIANLGSMIEKDVKKLQQLAIRTNEILAEELERVNMFPEQREARVYNMRSVGVQGDSKTYGHPAEITIKNPKHRDGRLFNDDELDNFLRQLSTRITNEIKDITRVVYVTGTKE